MIGLELPTLEGVLFVEEDPVVKGRVNVTIKSKGSEARAVLLKGHLDRLAAHMEYMLGSLEQSSRDE